MFDMGGKAEITDQTILASRPGVPGFKEGGTVVLTNASMGLLSVGLHI